MEDHKQLSPFCGNEKCLMSHYQVGPETIDIDVEFPNGSKFNMERIGFKFPNGGYSTFCKSCFHAFETIVNKKVYDGGTGDEPHFCSNKFCWLHTVNVDDDQNDLTITDTESHTEHETARQWMRFPDNTNKRYCNACCGAVYLTINPAMWPEPDHGSILLPN